MTEKQKAKSRKQKWFAAAAPTVPVAKHFCFLLFAFCFRAGGAR
jgi:hypothetical protein